MYRGFRSYKKKFARLNLLRQLLKFLLFAAAVILFLFNIRILPKIRALAEVEAKNCLTRTIQQAVSRYLADSSLTYGELVTLQYGQDGRVAALTANTPALNAAQNGLIRAVLSELSQEENAYIRIPLGTIFGGSLLSGRGPDVPIRVVCARQFTSSLESSFDETGINQTCHRIRLNLSLQMLLLLPGEDVSFSLSDAYPLCETVIVGEVPDTYTKINRLTDDIDETGIDDIYDFAHVD